MRTPLISFAAPTRARLPPHEAARSPAAASPSGRGATFSGTAPDLVALVAITLFIAAVVLWLDAARGIGGAL
jgi:hypothetical protein